MKQSRIFATGLAVLAGAALTAMPVSAQYFKGKIITVLVGYRGYIWARPVICLVTCPVCLKFWARHCWCLPSISWGII